MGNSEPWITVNDWGCETCPLIYIHEYSSLWNTQVIAEQSYLSAHMLIHKYWLFLHAQIKKKNLDFLIIRLD